MPALTRAEFDARLVRRCRSVMTAAGLDVTATSPNPDLDDPLAASLQELGWRVSGLSPTDADLAPLLPLDQARLIDLAELRVLMTAVTGTAGQSTSKKWFNEYEVSSSTTPATLQAFLAMKQSAYDRRWKAVSSAAVVEPMASQFRGGLDPRGGWPHGPCW